MSTMPRQKPLPVPKLAIGNNPERNRSHNRRVVLDAVRLHGPLGRTAIARLAHLTSQAVSNIVADLLDEGLLVECGRLRSGRGQPPVQIAVNPDVIENDATAAAVGERLHGAARNLKNYCLLYFGAGLGLGIMSEGRPLRGAFGNAGEIGHFVVSPKG